MSEEIIAEGLRAVRIYTDGSCSPNPGPGSWAAIILDEQDQRETLAGSEEATTNNRMELTAALKALQSLPSSSGVQLFTDSRYLKDGITGWLPNWQQRDWSTITGDAVRNRDLWRALLVEVGRHQVEWNWVKGHADDPLNNEVDELARGARPAPVLPLNDQNSVHIFLAITWRQKTASGAWAGIMCYREHHKVIGGARQEGTGNGLHIVSASEALKLLKRKLPIHIYTTSGYLKDGAGNWLKQWQRRDWYTRDGQEVSNREEWQVLAELLQFYPVFFHQVDKKAPPCQYAEAKELAAEFYSEATPQEP